MASRLCNIGRWAGSCGTFVGNSFSLFSESLIVFLLKASSVDFTWVKLLGVADSMKAAGASIVAGLETASELPKRQRVVGTEPWCDGENNASNN
jgi:hypothetical protein